MSELCETCPSRGDCTGPLENTQTMIDKSLFTKREQLRITRFSDTDGNQSKLFYGDVDTLIDSIDNCTGPIEVRDFESTDKSKKIPVCGVIGNRPSPDSYNYRFDHALKVADGTAYLDDALDKIETKSLRKLVYLGSAALCLSAGLVSAGVIENSRTLFDGGFISFFATSTAVVFWLTRAIKSMPKDEKYSSES